MPRLFYGHVMRAGVRINYYRTGGQKPPLVMLHDLGDNALWWNRIPLLLEVEYDVVLLDLRGHGSSGLDERGAHPELLAQDALDVSESLGLKRPVLIGHGLGAEAAALAAALDPTAVRGLVLEDPPWLLPAGADGRAALSEDLKAWLKALKEMPLEEIIAAGKRRYPAWHESEFFQWAKARQQFKSAVLDNLTQSGHPWQEILSRLSCPGLLFYGDSEAGSLIDTHTAAMIAKLWKKVRLVHVPGAGNQIHRERYDLYVKELAAFLRKLPK